MPPDLEVIPSDSQARSVSRRMHAAGSCKELVFATGAKPCTEVAPVQGGPIRWLPPTSLGRRLAQVRGMHTIIRDRETDAPDFVFYADRLLRLVRGRSYALTSLAQPCGRRA